MKRPTGVAAEASEAKKAKPEDTVVVLSDSEDEKKADAPPANRPAVAEASPAPPKDAAIATVPAARQAAEAGKSSSAVTAIATANANGGGGGSSSSSSSSGSGGGKMTKDQKMAIVQAMPWFQRIDTSNKMPQYTRRMMGELVRIFVETEHKDFVDFSPPVNDDLSKFHFLFKTSAAAEGSKLRQGLEQHGCPGIKCEMNVPPEFPMKPVFIRILHPKLTGGFVFNAGAICFEPLTPKGHCAAMSLPALCIALQAFFNETSGCAPLAVQKTSPDEKIPEYNYEAAAKEVKMIISAHGGGDKWSQQLKNMKS
eukprot:TRINITY_DN42257_c0_g1_i1.p2 TRINITY_DN42257_c0_g1~~TRINITY_DN42257_c0_g1_i1.p2  ORF type:complete len:311 (-),score=105.15 TRINITY_DN42257_c0_g1_i1:180-1112(-)